MSLLRIFVLLFILSSTGYAQSVKTNAEPGTVITLDGPVKKGPSPLFIINYRNKQYMLDTISAKSGALNPALISAMDILKGKKADSLYGPAARHGVIIIKIDKHKDRKALKELMKHLKKC